PGTVQAVAVTPDGALLAAAGEGGVRVWSLAGAPRVVANLDSATGATFFALAIGPPGRTLYAAGGDATVYRWDLTTSSAPRPLDPLTVPRGTVYSVAVDRAGTRLAAATSEGDVRLWDLTAAAGPRALAPLSGVEAPAQAVAFSPDGRLLAAGGANGTVRVWALDAQTRVLGPAVAVTAAAPAIGPSAKVISVAFDPASRRLATGTIGGQVRLWALTPSGSVVADGDPLAGPQSWVNGLAFSPDGATLAAAGSDTLIWRFDLRSRRALPTYPMPGPATAVLYTAAGRTLVSASTDASVRLWPSVPPAVNGLDRSYYSVRFSADGRRACTATNGDHALVVDTSDPTRPVPAGLPFGTLDGDADTLVGSCSISPDGTVVAVGGSEGSVRLWDVHDPAAPRRIGPVLTGQRFTVQYLAFSPDGRILAAAGNDFLVRVWNVTDPAAPRAVASLADARNIVFVLGFSADSRWMAAGDAAHQVWLYDMSGVATGAAPAATGSPLTGPTGYVYGVAISPDGTTLAAGGADKTVWLWDISDPAAPRVRSTLTGPTEMVNALAFSPDGRTLAAGNGDDTVWTWDVSSPAAVRHLATLTGAGGEVLALAFHPGGSVLAAGTPRGLIFWTTDADAAVREICSRAGERISAAEWNLYLPGRPYRPSCG
ncbi:MAG: WD40 repeat domain-containing protein, partial [Kineosporiaceae bacterium]